MSLLKCHNSMFCSCWELHGWARGSIRACDVWLCTGMSPTCPQTITAGMKSVLWSHLCEGWKVGKQKEKKRQWWCNMCAHMCVCERERWREMRRGVDGGTERSSHKKWWILHLDAHPPSLLLTEPVVILSYNRFVFQYGQTSVAFNLFCLAFLKVSWCMCTPVFMQILSRLS